MNTAIKADRLRAFQVAIITTLFDISLSVACFYGVGLLLQSIPALKNFVLMIGSIMVIYIGFSLIRKTPVSSHEVEVGDPLPKVAAICFSVTWFNPQAIIDGTLLLAGFKATLPAAYSNVFILGVAFASLLWFVGITMILSTFRTMVSPKILRWINIICGSIIIYYGLSLVFKFINGL
ncbi:MAG TPA: LysE family transporter [Negativicutes bacterium]|nr:LysE family transporter [Negativicutes bacterium]